MGKRVRNFGCTPCPEVAGYWQTFPLAGEEILPLVETPSVYTDVIVAFLAPDETGELHFTGPDLPTARDVCCLRQRGQRVLLLPLIDRFRDRLTRVHMQYYNSGEMTGLNGQVYTPGTVDFAVAMTEAVIHGFTIADTGVRYFGLAPWQVSIGLPVAPQAAVNGYLRPAQVAQAVCELRTGQRGERQPCAVAYPDLGGVMGWSVQWDATNDFVFARNAARAVCGAC